MMSLLHVYLWYWSSTEQIHAMGVPLRVTGLWPIYLQATPTYSILVVKTY